MRATRRWTVSALLCSLMVGCVDQPATAPEAAPGPEVPRSPDVGAQAVIPEFRIIQSATDDHVGGAAFDGTNYLVAYTTGSMDRVYARLIGPTGTTLATRSTGRTGQSPQVAFDGTNYLLAWADQTSFFDLNIFGQLISTAGTAVGPRFKITTTNDAVALGGLCFGGGQYLTTYLRFDGMVHRRFVSPAGVRGPDKAVSSGTGIGFNSCATDGTNFLSAWVDAQNQTVARLVRGDGTLGTERLVDTSPDSTNGLIPVAFMDGTYLVGWSDRTAVGDWNVYSRLVTAAGALSGVRRSIAVAVGKSEYLNAVTANGSNFVAFYADDVAGTAKAKVRFLGATGVPVSAAQLVFNPKSGRPVIGGPMLVNGTTYFFAVNRATPGTDVLDYSTYSGFDIYGAMATLLP